MKMMRWPELPVAFRGPVSVIYGTSEIDNGLAHLNGSVVSAAAGCQYYKAHTTLGACDAGVDEAKVKAVWVYHSSALFTVAERIARDLEFAPNAGTDEHFAALDRYYEERQKTELKAGSSMFSFQNRWNDTLTRELED